MGFRNNMKKQTGTDKDFTSNRTARITICWPAGQANTCLNWAGDMFIYTGSVDKVLLRRAG